MDESCVSIRVVPVKELTSVAKCVCNSSVHVCVLKYM